MPNLRDYAFKFHKKGGHDVIYEIAYDDETSATIKYYGFVNREGGWIIQKEDRTNPVHEFTYAIGTSDFATAWTGRALLTYVSYAAL